MDSSHTTTQDRDVGHDIEAASDETAPEYADRKASEANRNASLGAAEAEEAAMCERVGDVELPIQPPPDVGERKENGRSSQSDADAKRSFSQVPFGDQDSDNEAIHCDDDGKVSPLTMTLLFMEGKGVWC